MVRITVSAEVAAKMVKNRERIRAAGRTQERRASARMAGLRARGTSGRRGSRNNIRRSQNSLRDLI